MSVGGPGLLPGGLAFELAKKWWVLLIRGILLVIIGILAFINPLTWVFFVGAYMLVDGVSMLFAGFGDTPAGQSRWPLLIVGILGVVAGLLIFWNPVLGGITLVYLIAAWALIGGIFTIISAIRLRDEIDNEWWLVLSGILAVIFGLLVFFGGSGPVDANGQDTAIGAVAGLIAVSTVFGVFAILVGILSIVLAFRVRDFGTRIGAVT